MEICKLAVSIKRIFILRCSDVNLSPSLLPLVLFRYKGTYCSQEVAIKVLKPERLDSELEKEFAQEVFIMRFVCLLVCSLVVLYVDKRKQLT